jgi:anaerobic selenocysteine-containing dehydrogenase
MKDEGSRSNANGSVLISGACPHDCPDTCGVISEVRDGRVVAFRGDPDHPVTQGWLCAKVRPYLEHVYHPERLSHPLRRSGEKGSGRWQRITWDEALAEIAGRWREIIAGYGPEAILPYSYSGTLGLVQLRVSNGRFWNRLGASQLLRTICDAAGNMAFEVTLGVRRSPAYEDVRHSKLVILWGHNPVSTAPHFMPFLRQAQRRGARLVVIDPRRTRSAKGADLHLAPRPGTDGALALGMAHVIVAEGRHDETWLVEHTVGWPEYRASLADYPPERVAALTGLAEAEIVDLARSYADSQPALIKIADGLNRNLNGGQNVRAVCALPALTGQYGRRGGGLAYSAGGTLEWDAEAVNKWRQSPAPGRAINMNQLGRALLDETLEPPVKSLFVFAANPVASTPNARSIVAGLQRDDLFTVVHELFMSDTADYADIVLPATSQLEQTDLHKAYGHTYLTYNRAAIAPLGESKSNWTVMRLLAQAMGFDEPWLQQSEDEVIAEVLAATAENSPALRGISLERLQQEGTLPMALDQAVPFAGGRFPTPSGKVELFSQQLADLGLPPLPTFDETAIDDGGVGPAETGFDPQLALDLLTGAAHHFVSSSLANQPGLMTREGSPYVEIHPEDAGARGIDDGDPVVVENGRGRVTLRAVVTDAVRPGVLASPKGFWPKLNGGSNVNWTTPDALADMAGQSTFHSNRVWLRPAGEGD